VPTLAMTAMMNTISQLPVVAYSVLASSAADGRLSCLSKTDWAPALASIASCGVWYTRNHKAPQPERGGRRRE
jgi:hypothetical protein